MRRVLSSLFAAAYGLTAASLLAAIVVVAAGDMSIARDHGNSPGFALVMILQN